MDGLRQDLRYAVRVLLQHRGFTAVAVATLALGIGANTAIFTVVDALLLRPLAVADPGQLVAFSRADDMVPCSYPEYMDFRNGNRIFTGLAASSVDGVALGAYGEAHIVPVEMVSGNYFSVMRVAAQRGRLLVPEDDRAPGASPVAVVSYGTWKRRFGNDPSVVGTSVSLNGQPFTVVGIAPEGFIGSYPPASIEIWTPLMMAPQIRGARGGDEILTVRNRRRLAVIGRLSAGIGLGEAQAAIRLLDRQIQAAHPDTDPRRAGNNVPWGGGEVTLLRLRAFYMPEIRRAVGTITGLVMAVVFLVLLIACVNVANLLLARGTSRRREVAIRLALGASRGRIVRQLLTESLLLALVGAGAGLLLALWTADFLIMIKPPVDMGVMFTPDTRLDARVLGFTLMLSLVTGLLFGLAPALEATRPEIVPALKDEPPAGHRPRRTGVRSLLVIGQVAISLVLLIVTGLFVRSVQQTQAIDPGFDTANGVVMNVELSRLGYSEERGREFYRRLRQRLEGLPDVRALSLASYQPFGTVWPPSEGVLIEGSKRPSNAPPLMIGTVTIDPSHLPTLGVALRRGRNFSAEDTQAALPVVIVSEMMASRFWPGEDPIGKRLAITGPGLDSWGITPQRGPQPYRRVVGVAADIKYENLSARPRPVMYLPFSQRFSGSMYVVVRAGDTGRVASALRQEIRALDPNVPVDGLKTLAEQMDAALGLPRLLASIVGIFGLLGVVLAAVGIYGVVAYSVSQRTREIGIRIALGADRRAIFSLVVGHGMVLVLVGIAVGLPAAIAVRRLLWGLLHTFTLIPAEPLMFGGLSLLLAIVGLLASYVPSRRATKVDPLVALRTE
jgi:predicted permease